jgi:hypothetical protein
MRIISHRGNLNGPTPDMENRSVYIRGALYAGFNVEVDVWKIGDSVYLGHDEPIEELPHDIGNDPRVWFHCKNVAALDYFRLNSNMKYFWHQTDDYSLTSNEKIWVYPGKPLRPDSIAVLPETVKYSHQELRDCYAICTDYAQRYYDIFEEY